MSFRSLCISWNPYASFAIIPYAIKDQLVELIKTAYEDMTNVISRKILSGKSRFTYRVQGDINEFEINHYDEEHYIHTNVLMIINKVILITDSNIYTALTY